MKSAVRNTLAIRVLVHSNGKGSVGRWGPTRGPLRWRGMWGDGECGKN
ncbi:MAG: hypothetical protein F6K23_08960 [Okeania sp. SIO2C9]|nr:hypothetical protein [Okeania sp. SIO2C9]NEQ73193.1 hypothetical protein [Okeania sp. SIO2C9]